MAVQIDNSVRLMKSLNPDWPDRFFELMKEELDANTDKVMAATLARAKVEYAETFTIGELRALLAFLKSEHGRSVIQKTPELAQKIIQIGVEIDGRDGGQVGIRVLQRLKAEGLSLPQ